MGAWCLLLFCLLVYVLEGPMIYLVGHVPLRGHLSVENEVSDEKFGLPTLSVVFQQILRDEDC